jgi:hypothetical protein
LREIEERLGGRQSLGKGGKVGGQLMRGKEWGPVVGESGCAKLDSDRRQSEEGGERTSLSLFLFFELFLKAAFECVTDFVFLFFFFICLLLLFHICRTLFSSL